MLPDLYKHNDNFFAGAIINKMQTNGYKIRIDTIKRIVVELRLKWTSSLK
jgi:hypothetical protein